MSSRLPKAQLIFYATMFVLCSAAMSLSAVAHVKVHSVPYGPPPHVMHFQCVTIAYATVQQIYYIAHFITRYTKPKSAFLSSKVDIGFFVFMLSFGAPTTFINTSKINEFSAPWKHGDRPIPLPWRCVIGDTALLWVITIALVSWVITEVVVLYKRFGARQMWNVSIPILNQDAARYDDDLLDHSSMEKHSQDNHSFN